MLVEREVEEEVVKLTVENNGDVGADLEVTDIVTTEPVAADGNVEDGLVGLDDVTVVEMDGEWFLKWSASVPAGEEATLAYCIDGDAEFDLAVDGVEDAKLTINA